MTTTETAAAPASVETAPLALWTKLFAEVLARPGAVSEAYTAFHDYSLSNQVWLIVQHFTRNIPLGPCAGFTTWKARNRWVKKGEKAFCVLAPRKQMLPAVQEDGSTKLVEKLRGFKIQRTTFSYSQTDGDSWEQEPVTIGEIDARDLVAQLGFKIVPFEDTSGNIQGYATPQGGVAISPVAEDPGHTFLHELAHQVLGHCAEGQMADGKETPRSLREAEAESVALLVGETFRVGNPDYSRGYVQSWWTENGFPEDTAKKVFSAAERIYRAINKKEQRVSLAKAA